ncbi:MAG: D-alanine--D-alanine ligase [Chloroflexi bacterium]|nr:D-alanine--D-alanine ligase [Chloroflexota bacterium]
MTTETNSQKLRIGVLFGGRSGEHEVSLASARSVMDAMDRTRYEVVPIGITNEGRWLVEKDSWATLDRAFRQNQRIPGGSLLPPEALLQSVDVIFPVLHGPYGEDGTIQGLLELVNVPYVGAGVTGSAVGMDKELMKAAFVRAGLDIVPYRVFLRRQWEEDPDTILDMLEVEIRAPWFVKPVNLGSSVGISKAHDRQALGEAIALAASYDRKVVVEQAVDAREIEVSVLGNDEPEASVPGEVIPRREWYDYRAKYVAGESDLEIPANLSAAERATVRGLATRAYRAIDCAGMARADFLMDRDSGVFYTNELNTIPGFTATSMYPKLWEASGLAYTGLITRLIDLALERFADRQRSKSTFRLEE